MNDPIVKITLDQIYSILLDTQTKLAKLLTEVEYGNHESRISNLEKIQWKVTGISAAVAAAITVGYSFMK
jgi:hypothetical protein